MAFTVTNSMTVFGNKRVNAMKITADAASDTVATGLQSVDFLSIAPISMATLGIRLRANLTAASAASAGKVGISGCTSGDDFWLVAYGH